MLEENADAERYLLRRVLPDEAKGLVMARVLPRYPPIAEAGARERRGGGARAGRG